MSEPLVSVLTPSFNQACFIGDCLHSVAKQTYRNIEHIVVDGGSSDETVSLLRQTSDKVRWVSEPDRGQSHALNKALAMGQGEIIGWLNSDDAYADIRAVEWAVELFNARPEVGALYAHTLRIDANNRVLQYMWAPPFAGSLLERTTCFFQPSVFLRRSVLPEPFLQENLRFVMDRDLWLRLLPRTDFARLDRVVAVDRYHASRKVATKAYLAERDAYRQRGLGRPLPRPLLKPLTVALRLRGLFAMPSLAKVLQPALALQFDSVKTMAFRQALLPEGFIVRPKAKTP